MSLSGAMNSAVSAMQAQSSALSIISNNLANVSTTGYKASSASFSSLLTSDSGEGASGGVTVASTQNVLATGLLEASTSDTNVAIDGDGFLPVVTEDGGEVYYTRNGAFEIDGDGYLTNNGYMLVGWPTDADGNVEGGTTATNLEVIDTDAIGSYASATTTMELDGNLPANATAATSSTTGVIGTSAFTSEIEVFDSLGSSSTVTVTWTKTADNTWSLSFADPTNDAGTTTGTASTSAITIVFNDDGTLASTTPANPQLTITGLTDGAADLTIDLDLGTAGSSDGLTQLSDSDGTLSAAVTSSGDGVEYGTLSGVTIAEDGTVSANYSNNASIAIYKIPIATFANANGLTEMSSSVYAATTDSSTAVYHIAGTDGTGDIMANELEASTSDTNTEFSAMISAQQAYSAASQIISTAKDMFDSLLSAVR